MKSAARLVAAATGAVALALTGLPAYAADSMTTIARGLDNPRGLAFAPNGALYVAEAGRGGAGPCLPGPEGGSVCFGTSGAVTQIRNGSQSRVLTGLSSLANPDGTQAIGPSDVSFQGGGNLYLTVGLGANPAARAQLPAIGQQTAGWLLRGRIAQHDWTQSADIAGYEARANPDGGAPDSNPNSVLAVPGARVVVDSGGNDLVRVTANGRISTLAVFPTRTFPAPPALGMPPGATIPVQSVPTSVVRGPDGAYYVGELTGFPFLPGIARVWRVVPGHAPEVYASGFTNIIDIGFDQRGRLYVLEIARNGLLSGDPTGALIRVDRGGTQHVVASTGLTTPAGLALRGGSAYVSNCGTCAGTGSVVRIALH
ncbi:MAG TPA: ScyD/ScyE family protein [Micromonosporaceae bacterium]